jgi:hypothetical protein
MASRADHRTHTREGRCGLSIAQQNRIHLRPDSEFETIDHDAGAKIQTLNLICPPGLDPFSIVLREPSPI